MYLYCASLVLHIWLNWPLYLTNLNALTRFLRSQTTEWENVEPCESYLLDRNVSIDEATANCLTNTKTCLISCRKNINQMQFVVKWWNMKDGQNILQLAIPLNASAYWSRLHNFTSGLWLITAMLNNFFLDAATNLKQREMFLIEAVSTLLKLVCNLKHFSCKQFHNIVKGDFTF